MIIIKDSRGIVDHGIDQLLTEKHVQRELPLTSIQKHTSFTIVFFYAMGILYVGDGKDSKFRPHIAHQIVFPYFRLEENLNLSY